jgi:hypothetical protein
MPRVLIALLLLIACVDPRLNAGISLGGNGISVTPSISGGIPGGGTISYSP